MQLAEVQAFVEVARAGSVSRAADALFLTQPALTARVQRLETDLQGRVMRADGSVLQGVYAVGEAAGFGGGGVHGYRALEGTFLGGCLFSGRTAGRALASSI